MLLLFNNPPKIITAQATSYDFADPETTVIKRRPYPVSFETLNVQTGGSFIFLTEDDTRIQWIALTTTHSASDFSLSTLHTTLGTHTWKIDTTTTSTGLTLYSINNFGNSAVYDFSGVDQIALDIYIESIDSGGKIGFAVIDINDTQVSAESAVDQTGAVTLVIDISTLDKTNLKLSLVSNVSNQVIYLDNLRKYTTGVTLTANGTSYTYSGTAASPKRGRIVTAGAASYTFSGSSASTFYGRRTIAATTSFNITGSNLNFTFAKRVIATSTSLTFTPTDATLRQARKVIATGTSYTHSATAANLEWNRKVAANGASYTITGTAANFKLNRRVIAASASFTINGTPAGLIYSGNAKSIVADTTSYTVNGTAANLKLNRKVGAGAASYAFTGSDANPFLAGKLLMATGTSYIITTTAAFFFNGYRVVAGATSFSVTAQAASLLWFKELTAENTGYGWSADDVVLTQGTKVVIAQSASFNVNGTAANLRRGRGVIASGASYTVSGTAANFKWSRRIIASPAQYSFGDAPLLFKRNRVVPVIGTEYQIISPSANIYVLPAKSNDVTGIYKKGRGKKRFWRIIGAKDLQDKYNLD